MFCHLQWAQETKKGVRETAFRHTPAYINLQPFVSPVYISKFLLLVFAQYALQALAGEEDAALNRSEGKIHLFGDFIVLVAGNVH